ncbi:Mrx16 protein [Maudiozyma humilis]|uniref:Mrx16 protein n=1 Tax=Maudiozyma humilis TaxID=51915 RepID=A0AAV5RX46_MAUHU|nr:Mrx16 protein [Kazachstania humilis]
MSQGIKSEAAFPQQGEESRPVQKLVEDTIYTVQMGNDVFKLTGASFNSDGPNYFTEKFTQLAGKSTSLFLDRNAKSFALIVKHFQGYYLDIANEDEFSMLLADSIYYGLTKLTTDIKESSFYFANIGGKSFKFLKKLFRRDGDSNNYFQVFTNTINSEIEFRFVNNKLAVVPISTNFVSRSPEYFQILLDMLSGATVPLTPELRESLIKECKYYRFQNLEQRLVNATVSTNPFSDACEIKLHIGDVQSKGLNSPLEKYSVDRWDNHCMSNRASCPSTNSSQGSNGRNECNSNSNSGSNNSSDSEGTGRDATEPQKKKRKTAESQKKPWDMIRYKRPFVDDNSMELIFQLDSYDNTLIFNKHNKIIHMDISGSSLRMFDKTFNAFLSRQGINLNDYKKKFAANRGGKEEDHLVLPACISISDLEVNGVHCRNICQLITDSKFNDFVYDFSEKEAKRYSAGLKLHLLKSLWKLGIKDGQIMLIAIKLESFSGIKEYNKLVEFI